MIIRVKGGPGSGHRGHRGRPGMRGGSLPGKSGGGGGSIKVAAAPVGDMEKLDVLWDQIGEWEESSGKRVALKAVDDMMSRRLGYQGLVAKDSAGKVVGVLSYNAEGDVVKIGNVGTNGKVPGTGKRLVYSLVNQSGGGAKVVAEATVGSRTFYEHIGGKLREGTANIYEFVGEV